MSPAVNLQQMHVYISHHAVSMSLHYLVKYECQKNSDTLMKNINIINGYYIYTTNAAEIAHTSDSMWTCAAAVHGCSVCCRSEHAGPRVVDHHPVLIARVHCPVSSLPSTQLQPETQLQQVLQARNITHACDNDYRCRLLAFHLAETPRPCTAWRLNQQTDDVSCSGCMGLPFGMTLLRDDS